MTWIVLLALALPPAQGVEVPISVNAIGEVVLSFSPYAQPEIGTRLVLSGYHAEGPTTFRNGIVYVLYRRVGGPVMIADRPGGIAMVARRIAGRGRVVVGRATQ